MRTATSLLLAQDICRRLHLGTEQLWSVRSRARQSAGQKRQDHLAWRWRL